MTKQYVIIMEIGLTAVHFAVYVRSSNYIATIHCIVNIFRSTIQSPRDNKLKDIRIKHITKNKFKK